MRGRGASFAGRGAIVLAFALPFSTYLTTMARGLFWGDGIELTTVCATLGIAHPTGYPLFTLVGHLFTWLPIGSVAFRVTLFSALSIAAAAALVFGLLRLLHVQRRDAAAELDSGTLALAGALTFAWSIGPWSHATITEVYAFELIFQLAVMVLSFRILRDPSAGSSMLVFLALITGLGMTHHQLTLTLFPFLIAATAAVAVGPRFRTARRRLRLAATLGGAFVCGLTPILYLPLRASQSPPMNWGDPSSPARLFWTLTGGDYLDQRLLSERPGQPFSLESFLSHLAHRSQELADYLVRQLLSSRALPAWVDIVLLILGAILVGLGAARLFRLQPVFTIAWAAAVGLYLTVLMAYNIGDIGDYQLGLYGLLWPVLWIGLVDTARFGSARPIRGSPRRLLPLALPLALLLANYADADRSRSQLADYYARHLLTQLPPRAILLTEGDYATATAWYLQLVEGKRPDVLVYCLNFLYYDWYQKAFEPPDRWGREVSTSPLRPTDGKAFSAELRRLVIEPNVDRFPIFIISTPPMVRRLGKAYRLQAVSSLLPEAAHEKAYLEGVQLPPGVLYQIFPRKEADGKSVEESKKASRLAADSP